jgi:hypothetical protein
MTSAELRRAVVSRLLALSVDLALEMKDSKEFSDHWKRASRSPVHKEFCVGVPLSSPLQPARIKSGRPGLLQEDLSVGLAYQLRAGADRATDTDALLELERQLRNGLIENWSPEIRLEWQQSARTPGPDAWIYTEIRFLCYYSDSL